MKSYHYYQYNPEDVDNFAKSAGLSAIFLHKNKEHSDSWAAPFISWSIEIGSFAFRHPCSYRITVHDLIVFTIPFSETDIYSIVTSRQFFLLVLYLIIGKILMRIFRFVKYLLPIYLFLYYRTENII